MMHQDSLEPVACSHNYSSYQQLYYKVPQFLKMKLHNLQVFLQLKLLKMPT